MRPCRPLPVLALALLLAACGSSGGGAGGLPPGPPAPPTLTTFSATTDAQGAVTLPAALGGERLVVVREHDGVPLAGILVRAVARGTDVLVEAGDPSGAHASRAATGTLATTAIASMGGDSPRLVFDTLDRLSLPARNRLAGNTGHGLGYLKPGLLRDYLATFYTYRETVPLASLTDALSLELAAYLGEEIGALVAQKVTGLTIAPQIEAVLAAFTLLDLADASYQTVFGLIYESLCYPPTAPMEIWVSFGLGPVPQVFVLPAESAPASGPAEQTTRVQGVVTDARTGLPLSGARVRVVPGVEEAVSAADGAYAFDWRPRCTDPALAWLEAVHDGYLRAAVAPATLGLVVGQARTLDLGLLPGTPVALGANVCLVAPAGTPEEAWFWNEGRNVVRLDGFPGDADLAAARLVYVLSYITPTAAEKARLRAWVAAGGRLVLEAGALLFFNGANGLADELSGGGAYANSSGNNRIVATGPVPSTQPVGTVMGGGGAASAGHAVAGGTALMLSEWIASPGIASFSHNLYGLGDCFFAAAGPDWGAAFTTFWGDCMRYALR